MTETPIDNVKSGQGRIAVLVLLALALATAVTAAVSLFGLGATDPEPFDRLLPAHRATPGRVSGLDHRPWHTAPPPAAEGNSRVWRALAHAQSAVSRDSSVGNLHRLARIRLATGDAAAAIPILEEIRTNDAAATSDLAAAEIALGRIFDAIEHSAQALELDRASREAAFNFALALEKAGIRTEAIAAWLAYLKAEPASPWAVEARQHLAELQAPRSTWEADRELLVPAADPATIARLVRQYPQRSRARTHNILLPSWIESGTAENLALIRAIAKERAAGGDPFLSDVVENAVRSRAAVAAGFRAFTAARAANQTDMEAAGRLFDEAAAILGRSGSPLAIAAAIYAASAEFYAGRPTSALERYDAALRQLADLPQAYPGIKAEALWGQGLVLSQIGEPRRCLATYRLALDEAVRAGEIETRAYIQALIASQLEVVDEPEEAERQRLASLLQLDAIHGHSNPVYVAFADTASAALLSGRPHLALVFAKAQSAVAAQVQHPLLVAESKSQLALALIELGQREEALRQIAAAQEEARGITVPALRDRTLSTADYVRGRIYRGQPQRQDDATAAFSSAIDRWRKYGWRMHLASGYLARGTAFIDSRDEEAAEQDFLAGIREMESQRAELGPEPALSVTYFERADETFDRLVALLLRQGRTADALSIVERKRARRLLEQMEFGDTGRRATLDAAGIAALTDRDTAIVEIAFVGGWCDVWVAYDGRVSHRRSPADRKAIVEAAGRHRQAIARGDLDGIRREGRWLEESLFSSVASLPPETTLVIVPDGELQAFPFASLTTADGQYLVERHPLVSAPSASVHFRSRSRQGEQGEQGLVAVAQPAPQGFDLLVGAEAETRLVAPFYRRSAVFIGEEARAAAFLDLAGAASVVHFAGHATTDLEKPARSALIFESPEAGSERLTAETIAAAKLRAHPLIVLAACSTGRGKLRRNEGADSLAIAFLHAGARGVVATLWDINDRLAIPLFRSFHLHLAGGKDPARSLREAQLELIRSQNQRERNPAAWSGAVIIGS